MMKRIRWTLVLVILVTLCDMSSSRSITAARNDDLFTHAWKAYWITHPAGPRREFGVFHFRKAFTLASVPRPFIVHVSGDNRYELFVNGERALTGPARGDLNYWRYETVDIALHLAAGRNVLAAVVWNFAERAPVAQITNETGLIVEGDGSTEEIVNSDGSWKTYE